MASSLAYISPFVSFTIMLTKFISPLSALATLLAQNVKKSSGTRPRVTKKNIAVKTADSSTSHSYYYYDDDSLSYYYYDDDFFGSMSHSFSYYYYYDDYFSMSMSMASEEEESEEKQENIPEVGEDEAKIY